MKAKITLVVITLLVSLALQTNAAEVKGFRYYSESNKTRIVIQLNNLTQYQTRVDLEHNMSISIPNSELNGLDRSLGIGDGLVKTVALKELKDNTVDVKISSERPASFNVFPLDSPARIVVDVTPVDNVQVHESAVISPQEPQSVLPKEVNKPETKKDTKPDDNANAKASSENTEQVIDGKKVVLSSSFGFGDVTSWYTNINYTLIQLGFDILIMAILVYIVIKVKIVLNFARFIKKRSRSLKGNKVFADMLIELEKGFSQEQERKHEDVSKSKSANVERKAKKTATEQISVPKQYDKVHEMAQRGMDPLSISQKSNIPIGEVTLILDLIKAKREGQTSS